ncbi:MAG: hypothetical protein RLY89_2226, partial [Bacteroidota bacterium]
SVAGPVFKEIADRLYSTYVKGGKNELNKKLLDSSLMSYAGYKKDMARVMGKLKLGFRDSASDAAYVAVKGEARDLVVTAKSTPLNLMPELNGMGLKDAVYVCENMGLKLNIRGKGKVMAQSITAGLPVVKGQLVEVELN